MSKKTTKQCCSYCKEEIPLEELENENSSIIKRGTLRFHSDCFDKYSNSDEKPEIKVRMRTCPQCKGKLSPLDDDAIDSGNSTYHKGCYDAIKRAEKNRNDLIDYVALKYNMEFPTGFMLKQISEYHSKRGYSYKAMKACMVYIIEVEKIPVKEGTGLGLIPHYYERAKLYYSKLAVAREASQSVVIDNKPIKIVAKVEKNKKNSRQFRLKDL